MCHLGNLPRLVISTENGHTILVADLKKENNNSAYRKRERLTNLQADEERHSLDGVVSTVDVVSHEQIVRVWTLTAHLE